jgi:hypothetical protein
MPPKKKPSTSTFSLKEALNFINNLPNPTTTKTNWTSSLSTLVHYDQEGEMAYPSPYTKAEIGEKYGDVNIVPLINDIDKVTEIVETKIRSSRNGAYIALDTQKQYWLSIVRLTQKNSKLQIDKELKEKYNEKLKEADQQSNQQRNLNKPKRANLQYPDFRWIEAQDEYEAYLSSKAFTNTAKGITDLKHAVLVGLYILQRPRRIQDYSLLQYFSKKPSNKEAEKRNIVYKEGDKLFFSIDVFKTRMRVRGNAKEAKELMPRYVKEVNSRLASLLKDYIKKTQVKDMSKLTTAEKRQNKQFYVFSPDNKPDVGYTENTFSKVVSNAFQKVFNNRKGLTVNTFRHMFNTYLAYNITNYTDAQLQEISIDVGDTPKQMPTNLRYRIAAQANEGMEKTEIDGLIRRQQDAYNDALRQVEVEGSVGNIEQQDDVDADEVASPAPPDPIDGDLDTLYKNLGKVYIELKQLELVIARKLGMGA